MRIRLLWLLLAAWVAAGCDDPRIERYRVARVDPAPRPPLRTLGAIVPRPDMVWFAKLMGPAPKVEAERESFESFVRSLRFPSKGPRIEWDTPPGWTPAPSKGMRFATFLVGQDQPRMEVTLIPLGPEAASVLDNVNRWRRELELAPIDEQRLGRYLTRVEVDGGPAVLVDLAANEETVGAAPDARTPLTWTLPPGWKALPSPGPMRTAAFHVEEGGDRVEVTVVGLAGAAGGMEANVNRWRGQIGLPPAGEAEIEREMVSFPVGDGEGKLADLAGARDRILAAIVSRPGMTWFFKMQGPRELVGRRKEEFQSFVRSARFDE
jgi:hypothetical protein